jgi:ParB-like chromosome segregation protein Spo0J
VELWPLNRLVAYERNPRKNEQAVNRIVATIQQFGFKVPILARSGGEIVDGHLRIKAAKRLGIQEVPVILCDEWTSEQVNQEKRNP